MNVLFSVVIYIQIIINNAIISLKFLWQKNLSICLFKYFGLSHFSYIKYITLFANFLHWCNADTHWLHFPQFRYFKICIFILITVTVAWKWSTYIACISVIVIKTIFCSQVKSHQLYLYICWQRQGKYNQFSCISQQFNTIIANYV